MSKERFTRERAEALETKDPPRKSNVERKATKRRAKKRLETMLLKGEGESPHPGTLGGDLAQTLW